MDVGLFDYLLPPERIAQYPAEPRDACRLLVCDRATGRWQDHRFSDLPDLLQPADCLVVNDSRVIPARLWGRLDDAAGGRVEVELLFVKALGPSSWEALARPGHRARPGTVIVFGDGHGQARARVVGLGGGGRRILELEGGRGGSIREALERYGVPPLPPYIRHHREPRPEDRARYQTVYARHDGSVAAPTAGLHFTLPLLDRLRSRDLGVQTLTLHVGPGTFRPIRAARVEDHRVDAEEGTITPDTARAINRVKRDGRRVVAVGTTTCRALESAAAEPGRVEAMAGPVDLFIFPGYRFRVVDALLTNFHLPRSSLLVLVSAFAGREFILDAYRHAVEAGYRFYSYGDAMLIV